MGNAYLNGCPFSGASPGSHQGRSEQIRVATCDSSARFAGAVDLALRVISSDHRRAHRETSRRPLEFGVSSEVIRFAERERPFQTRVWKGLPYGSPNEIRTRVAAVRGRCPRPLDDGTRGFG